MFKPGDRVRLTEIGVRYILNNFDIILREEVGIVVGATTHYIEVDFPSIPIPQLFEIFEIEPADNKPNEIEWV